MTSIQPNPEKELATPPLNGLILPGVVRQSILEIAANWEDVTVTEREFTMRELRALVAEKRVLEIFGSGTACVVSPVGRIFYKGQWIELPSPDQLVDPLWKRALNELQDIQYGQVKPHPWAQSIDDLQS